jgi:hypothetical protein
MFKKILQRMFILALIFIGLFVILIGGIWIFSRLGTPDPVPLVSIHSPPNGGEVGLGGTVAVNSTSWDEKGTITSVELWSLKDGILTLVERSSILEGKKSVSLAQGWQPLSVGNYRLIVRAFNELGNSGQAALDLQVVEDSGDESILEEEFSPPAEGGFDPFPPDPGGGGDPSPPPPNPDPNPPDPPIFFPVLFDLLMELYIPPQGTWVEVEALAFQVQEQYDELHCFVGLGDYPPERVPETGSFQVSSIYSWNLQDYLGGNNKAVVFVPDNESLDLYLECIAFRQNSSLPLWPGSYQREHPPADWTGQVIVGDSDNGEGFTVSYRINPVGGPLMAPTNFAQFTFNNRTLLSWTWAGDENEIDGFKIFRENSHVATVYKTQRITEIPDWWIVPPCGEEYHYTIVAYKDQLQSAPSNYLPYQGAVCGGEDGVTSLNSQMICGGTGQKFSVDYRYQSPHGTASIGLQAFKEGELVTAIHSTRVGIQHGEGSGQVALTYHGPDMLVTDQISVLFYDHTSTPFYVQSFDYSIEWEPGIPELTIPSARVDRDTNQLRIKIKNAGCALPPVENPMVSIKRGSDGWTGFMELGDDLAPRSQALMTLDIPQNELELWGGEITLEVDPFDNVEEMDENNNTYKIDSARIKHVQVYKIDVHNDHDATSKGEWWFFTHLYEVTGGGSDVNYTYIPFRKYKWGTGFHDINNLFYSPELGANDSVGLHIGGFEDDFWDSDNLGDVYVYHSADGNPVPECESRGWQLMGNWKSGGEYSALSDKGDYRIFYRIILE